MWRRNDRVNERDVPESQHTIFIRGLPGNMGTDEIRDFFEADYGSCSFDFVKMSPDRTKLYIAVRFDSKAVARKVMDRYGADSELLGYKVELTWFRDIRRYLAHCAKQGVRPSRYRGGGGGGGMGMGGGRGRRSDDEGLRGGRARARSRSSRSHSEAHSRSASAASRGTQSRSRSVSASRSRSRSASTAHSSSRADREKSLDYSDIVVKKERRSVSPSPSPPPAKKKRERKPKKERKERRKRRHRSSPSPRPSSVASMGSDDEALIAHQTTTANIEAASQPKIFIGPKQPSPKKPSPAPQPPPQQQQQPQQLQSGFFAQRYVPAGSVSASTNDLLNNSAGSNKAMASATSSSIMLDLSNTRHAAAPKFKPIGELSSNDYDYMTTNGGSPTKVDHYMRAGDVDHQQQQQRASTDIKTSMSPPPPPALRNMPTGAVKADMDAEPPVAAALNNFKNIQRAILQDIRYKPSSEALDEEDGGGSMGQLRLSSLTRKTTAEEKREERLAKLSPELRERIEKKKRQLELSYRSDCETYGLVANKLIAKDRNLEGRLKIALLETMKELELETMKQLDDYLDQLTSMF